VSVAAVVLAAGGSKRLGQPKQLLRLAGETLVHRAARAALEAGCVPVLVVTGGTGAAVARAVADLAVACVPNPAWQEGMAASIRAGVEKAHGLDPLPTALLILLADQLAVDAACLRALLDAHRERPEQRVACAYAATPGVPALFPAADWGRLLALRGDRGAQALLAEDPGRLLHVPLPGGERDVDHPEDAEALD